MGKNTGEGTRQGAVKDREQYQDTKSGKFVKVDKTTGEVVSTKVSKGPYKGISKTGHDKK